MKLLTKWIRSYLPTLPVSDRQLAEDLTLRGVAVEGEFPATCGGTMYEMDITTNRVDAMNHYGVAREAAAIYDVPLQPLAQGADVPALKQGEGFPVRIEADDLCGRFTARIVRGVTVGPSKGELAEYFAALGQKPISAPVDVTNFGWLAMGQPTHAFDLDKVDGGIVVRRANAGEKLMLLDGSERALVPEDLVVADHSKALGLAGVMGGFDSRVTEQTTNILVEAAWFDPVAVRASSRRHGLHTDASHRFERGADFAAAPAANNFVTRLVLEQCGGEVIGPLVDVVIPSVEAKTAYRAPIELALAEVTRQLGTTVDGEGLSAELVRRYLAALGCTLASAAEAGTYRVTLPSWRLDLARPIDLIEEVARVYGYNKFANTLPSFSGAVVEQPHAQQERALRTTLLALGYSEAISSTFTSAEEADLFGPPHQSVAMGNPLNAEAGMLRPSLVPGMATMLASNLHRDVAEARLFELGTVFTGSTVQVEEAAGLSLGLTGKGTAGALYAAADALFYEIKGVLETVLAKFPGAVTFDAALLPAWIEPGRGSRALLGGEPVAVFGELSAAEAAGRKLRQTCVLAEVKAAALLLKPLRQPAIHELSRFQAVARDFSFVFPDSLTWDAISAAVQAAAPPELQQLTPIEVFRDPKAKAMAAGSHSMLLRLIFQSAERTLTDDELTGWSAKVTSVLTALGGTQRA